eukprot:TRINITY_DN9862_c0_g1_i1.p1 TRINITY_DN9862_c0_g1~~TRINITY_DN9862_c0_g1_i1.p1  ORF type:complete len:862 (+),score=113.98 TRINITY_DN9862_c0_g1_i1:68-2587(+)
MVRCRAVQGPLSCAAATGPRAAIVCFDIDESAAGVELRNSLIGFVLRRRRSGTKASVWIGDPRQPSLFMAPKRSEEQEQHEVLTEGAEGAVDFLTVGEGPVPGMAAQGAWTWQKAVRRSIKDFKWGDYSLEPDTEYVYKLCALCGDATWGIEAAGEEPPTKGPGIHVAASVELSVRTPPLHGLEHEVHFNRGVTGQRYSHLFPEAKDGAPREALAWQWLSRGLEEALLRFIDNAPGEGWQIRAALYEAHYLPVIRALAQARARGVSVELVVDWKMGYWSEEKRIWNQRGPQHMNLWALHESGLLAAGCVHQRTRPVSAISHNKFFLLVAPGGQAEAVWTGSTNITSGAIFGHSNMGHVVRDKHICEQYLKYWNKIKEDPDKKIFAAFNEENSPLPSADWAEGSCASSLALFSPRLRWAHALDFFAQLIRSAKNCVAFTAAFGISKDVAPALLGNDAVMKYILLESEGQWAASREAVRELRKRPGVRVAMGMHLEGESSSKAGFLEENLTGLNAHVKYVHTKILLIDPFSDCPIVVTGSANFSRASMESNDENMIVVRGNTDLADAYVVEYFRIFEHMRFRNAVEAKQKKDQVEAGREAKCRCNLSPVERVCKAEGPNQGRPFATCRKPRGQGCGYFLWLDLKSDADRDGDANLLPWPCRSFTEKSFDFMERRVLGQLRPAAAADATPELTTSTPVEEPCIEDDATSESRVEALEAMGVLEDDLEADVESTAEALAALSVADVTDPHPPDKIAQILKIARELVEVKSNAKGGTQLWRGLRDQLRAALTALPEQPVRAQALDMLERMDRSFLAKTQSTWRPFVLQILAVMGTDIAAEQALR